MAAANISGDESQKPFHQIMCSADLTAGIHGQLTFISGLNIFLSITAFLGNALILATLRKESSLHSPSKLLLRSLATTDLCAGLITQPLFATYLMSIVNEPWNICRFLLAACFTTSFISCLVSLFNTDCNMRGQTSRPDVGAAIQTSCNFEANLRSRCYLLGFVHSLFNNAVLECPNNHMECLYSYIPVFSNLDLLLHKDFPHPPAPSKSSTKPSSTTEQANQLNIERYRKAVSTALWIQLTLVACYLPDGIVVVFVPNSELTSSVFISWGYTFTLLLLNSSLNPIFYCWKINEVRQATKDTSRQVLCCSSS